MFEKQKDKGQCDFLEGEFGKERSGKTVEGGRTRAWDTSEFPVSFCSLPSSSSYPTPLRGCYPTHPILLTPLLPQHSQPQTLAFCMKGVNPMNNPVCLSQNKPVGEGSVSKPGRLEQRGAQPLVISPGSGSTACSDPQPLAQYTLPCCLPAWLTD